MTSERRGRLRAATRFHLGCYAAEATHRKDWSARLSARLLGSARGRRRRGGGARGEPIRLLLVDDHQMVLDGLRAMLRPHAADVEVVAATTDPAEARRLVVDSRPDVALIDVRMRSMSGLELCAELLRLAPEVKVVLLTVYDDEQYLYEGLRAGRRAT
ncbi:MAG: response regulator transcription factor [Ilumatobacteraceae bacterium]